MSTSTLKLYTGTPLFPDKNFIVDSFETYLSSISGTTTITKFQYIKHSLSLMIDINKGQANLDFFTTANNINYVSIQNTEDTYPIYYFVLRKVWLSSGAIRFVLKMDTLNTFTPARNNYVFSPRTLVDREHQDRFGLFYGEGSTDDYTVDVDILFNKNIIADMTGQSRIIFDHINVTFKYFDTNKHKFINSFVYMCAEIRTDNNEVKIYTYNQSDNPTLKEVIYLSQLPDNIQLFFNSSGSYDDFYCAEFGDLFNKVYPFYAIWTIKRTIHLYSEGLTPILFKTNEETLTDKNLPNVNWYLVYKNQNNITPTDYNQINPVECYILQDNPINVAYDGGSNVISVASLEYGKIYYVRKPTWNDSAGHPNDITLTDDDGNSASTFISNSIRTMIYFYKSGNDIIWGTCQGSSGFSWQATFTEIGSTKYLTPDTNPLLVGISQTLLDYVRQSDYESITTEDYMTLASSSVQIDGIDDVDRTSSKMIKIIKLPYCPIPMTKTGSVYSFDRTKYDFKTSDEITGIAIKDLNAGFLNTIYTNRNNPYYKIIDVDFTGVSAYDARNPYFESKLLHSDYYQPKFVYDSFSYVFRLEYCSLSSNVYQKFDFKFKMTTTINSKFMFEFIAPLELDTEDYSKILPVARNNEMSLYNNQYINYLRTGYNYDVKTKNRQEVASVVGTGLSLIGSIASFASSAVTGGVGIAAGITLATTATMNAVNTANTIAQSEQNIQAKIQQTKAQSTNVSGSDDVDLMSYYSGNRGKLITYELSPRMKQAMFDVFHYNGYISGEMKQPATTGRIWFNFVKADVVFSLISNIPDDCLEDIKECFKNGVYYMHRYNNQYNFNRSYENWETFIAEEVL